METFVLPQAAVFDLDGVVTFTARVHAASWKELFDSYLRERERRFGEPFQPFDTDQDYRAYVDGKARYDGVRSFLKSRGITLAEGSPADPPDAETVCGLGNRKNRLFVEKTREIGVDVDYGAVRFVRELRNHGVRVGLASSSKNAGPILEQVGLIDLFEIRVDGVLSEKLSLHSKPAPDIFLTCLEMLLGKADAQRSMVVEDAIAGVEAGKRGHFGLVLGVDRHNEAESLLTHGADLVISNFNQISADKVADYFRARESAELRGDSRGV